MWGRKVENVYCLEKLINTDKLRSWFSCGTDTKSGALNFERRWLARSVLCVWSPQFVEVYFDQTLSGEKGFWWYFGFFKRRYTGWVTKKICKKCNSSILVKEVEDNNYDDYSS